jgi:hypothetical protein
MEETHKLRTQIGNIVQANFLGVDISLGTKLRPPNGLQVGTSYQVVAKMLTPG